MLRIRIFVMNDITCYRYFHKLVYPISIVIILIYD